MIVTLAIFLLNSLNGKLVPPSKKNPVLMKLKRNSLTIRGVTVRTQLPPICLLRPGLSYKYPACPLLAAFEKADFRRPVTLVVMGTGPLEKQARALAARSTPARRVVVLPFQQIDAIPEIYASCDVLVLPSREDPWPLVVVPAPGRLAVRGAPRP